MSVEKVLLQRVLAKRQSPILIHNQVKQCVDVALRGSRGKGWTAEIAEIRKPSEMDDGRWKYLIGVKFSTTTDRGSVSEKIPDILTRLAESGSSGNLAATPYTIVVPDGYRDIAKLALDRRERSNEQRELSLEVKELGEVNLIPDGHFDRIYGRDPQIRRVLDAIKLGERTNWNNRKNCLLDGPPGCHAAGTKLIRANGRYVNVEDVKVGDRLLSYNGYKTVQSLCRGFGNMFCIVPTKGSTFIVNEDHILTLSKSRHPNQGTMIDVSVRNYLQWSKNKKNEYKLIRSSVVQFDCNYGVSYKISPYMLGVFLGDGCLTKKPLSITCHKDDIKYFKNDYNELAKFLYLNVNYRSYMENIINVSFTKRRKGKNPLSTSIEELRLYKTNSFTKFIPDEYKYSSVDNRLELLAGLIDTDGTTSRNYISFTTKSTTLAFDTMFIAQSLGFYVHIRFKPMIYKGEIRSHYRLHLSGDLERIPCRVARKKCTTRKQIKSTLRTGFSIIPAGQGLFYGFTLDGDGRYLLQDFTITHNSGKSEILACTAKMLGAENEAYLLYDGTNLTKAGVIEQLMESAFIPPVLFVEEIEKCEELSLRWLLGLMDTRGRIQRTNYKVGNQAKNVRMLVIATANNIRLLKSVMSGALYSRFHNKIFCGYPDSSVMRQILEREVRDLNGNMDWIPPALNFAEKWGINDPREIINIVSCGGDRLLSGEYQKDYELTMHPQEKIDLVKKMKQMKEFEEKDKEITAMVEKAHKEKLEKLAKENVEANA